MNARHSRRNMSHDEREDRARLKGGALPSAYRQMEETSWGKVLFLLGGMAGVLVLINSLWHHITEAIEAPDVWMRIQLGVMVAVFLMQIWFVLKMLFKMVQNLRKPPAPNEPAPLSGQS